MSNVKKTIDIARLLLSEKDLIKDAAKIVRHQPEKIALIVDDNGFLTGTVTDALIRTALLSGRSVSDSIQFAMHTTPDYELVDRPGAYYEELMRRYEILQLPLLDNADKIAGVATLNPEWMDDSNHPIVVLMVGGLGTRLSPLTAKTPKPMVEIGGKPILEHILERFARAGFRKYVFSVNFMAEVIVDYFSSGEKYDVSIDYLYEKKKMGTAGSLSFLAVGPDVPVFVANGDMFCDFDLGAMMTFHQKRKSDVTVGVNSYSQQIPYGVVSVENQRVVSIEEKPITNFLANSGAYVLQSEVLDLIPKDEFFDMPTLLNNAAMAGRSVQPYALYEPWLDIGTVADLEKAKLEFDTRENE